MTNHPYRQLPEKAFWRRSVSDPAGHEVDPVGEFDLRIAPDTKVATAGSCFAQHIARHLAMSGFNYHVVEPGHPILDQTLRDRHQYGLFSARYGNIYTARQLLQLIQRAYGSYRPREDAWVEPDGRVRDPFRPRVEPGGFASLAEMHADRAQHLTAVRRMFETLEVFIFTLGLTECWVSREDGAVFPLCPGVEGGEFDEARHQFLNQDVSAVTQDLRDFLHLLKSVNPRASVVLTVSPVPLVATAVHGEHVLGATTYSKSVLRVASEVLRREMPDVHYFPSFEIITGNHARGRYFADDLRSVTEEGVDHVMRLFLRHAAGVNGELPRAKDPAGPADTFLADAARLVQAECDEVALDKPGAVAGNSSRVPGGDGPLPG